MGGKRVALGFARLRGCLLPPGQGQVQERGNQVLQLLEDIAAQAGHQALDLRTVLCGSLSRPSLFLGAELRLGRTGNMPQPPRFRKPATCDRPLGPELRVSFRDRDPPLTPHAFHWQQPAGHRLAVGPSEPKASTSELEHRLGLGRDGNRRRVRGTSVLAKWQMSSSPGKIPQRRARCRRHRIPSRYLLAAASVQKRPCFRDHIIFAIT